MHSATTDPSARLPRRYDLLPDELCDFVTRDCRSGCNLGEAEPSNDHWIGHSMSISPISIFLEEIETFQDHLYISEGENLVAIVDIGNPNTPLYAGTLQPSWYLLDSRSSVRPLGKRQRNIFRYDLSPAPEPELRDIRRHQLVLSESRASQSTHLVSWLSPVIKMRRVIMLGT